MKYLVQKLETRYNSIIKFNKLLDSSNTSEAFYSLKKDFKLLFNDLEEDFRQGIFAIKALTSQNIKLQLIKVKDKKPPEMKKENIIIKNDINKKEAFDKFEKRNEIEIDNNIINYENNNNNEEKKQIGKLKNKDFELE